MSILFGIIFWVFVIGLGVEIIQRLSRRVMRNSRNEAFYAFSETTCNRCGTTVQAHSRVGKKAFYTCPKCHRSFTQKLYNPEA